MDIFLLLPDRTLLKNWSVTDHGSYVDGVQVSNICINDLALASGDFFMVKLGVKDDALNQRGINLFGKEFGNYAQDIIATIHF